MKKYRLKIPEMIRREDSGICEMVFPQNGDVITNYNGTATSGDFYLCLFSYIPSDWLEEIKDEPVSAEEYIKNTWPDCPEYTAHFSRTDLEEAFSAGEANERLRHRPQQTLDELEGSLDTSYHRAKLHPQMDITVAYRLYYRKGFNDCLKTHNLK